MATTRERITPESRNLVKMSWDPITRIVGNLGIYPPPLAEWIVNLGEAAEYIFDHTLFQDNLVFVDWCESMVKSTNPSVWARAEQTEAPHADIHGYRTIAEIMSSFEPFKGETYLNALVMSRLTREMFCLMEGRHVHPSTMYPGGVGTVATPQVFTDYLVRLMRCIDFVKKAVAMNDDVFDFWYEALPGYEEVGRRRVLLNCWGAWQDPTVCDYDYRRMNDWGKAMYVTPGIVVDGELLTNNLVDINLGMRILLGSSYYEPWESEETYVDKDPLGNPIDKLHVKARNGGVEITLPKTPQTAEMKLEWRPPQWSNAIERDRARAYFIAY